MKKKPKQSAPPVRYPTMTHALELHRRALEKLLVGAGCVTALSACSPFPVDVKSAEEYQCLTEQEVKLFYKTEFDVKDEIDELKSLRAGMDIGGESPVKLRIPEENYFSITLEDGTEVGLSLTFTIYTHGDEQQVWTHMDQIIAVVTKEVKGHVRNRIQMPKIMEFKLRGKVLEALATELQWEYVPEIYLVASCPQYRWGSRR